MKWIVAGVLAGWAGIVWLAWTMASERIALCAAEYMPEAIGPCLSRATATRDAVLIWGPAVALVLLAGLALLWQRERISRPASSNQAQRPIPAAQRAPERLR